MASKIVNNFRQEINQTSLFGKEPSLTVLPNGTLIMIAQGGYFGPGAKYDEHPLSRSEDGGRTWEMSIHKGDDYPRNIIVEPDGSLLMITGVKPDWENKGNGSPNLLLSRFIDNGKTWAKPWQLTTTAQVHAYLTELHDGRLLCTYSNYHVPYGVSAILSTDGGKTWDMDNTIRLSVSNGYYVGWAVTLELPDHSLITSYAATTYREQGQEKFTSEVVHWKMPD